MSGPHFRAFCPGCRREITVNKSGVFKKHSIVTVVNVKYNKVESCYGSGTKPMKEKK